MDFFAETSFVWLCLGLTVFFVVGLAVCFAFFTGMACAAKQITKSLWR